jgi:hypothetical protein
VRGWGSGVQACLQPCVCLLLTSSLCTPPACVSRAARRPLPLPPLPSDALAGSKFLQPDQVESLIARLCEKEGPLLSLVYGCSRVLGAAAGGGVAPLVKRGDARGLVKVFFLRALAVPPNK